MNHSQVIIDSRESRSKVPAILERNLKCSYKTLLTGDYQISDEIIFERKSYDDFCHSIMDGRLYKQAERMGEQFPNPIIILEGGPEYGRSKRRTHYKAQLSRGAVNSAALRCVVDYGVSILPSLSAADTARIIIKGVEQLGKPKKILRTNTKKKGKTLTEKRQNVIEAFPGIGPKLATNINKEQFSLLELLKSIDKCDIEGLGPKKIKAIQEVLHSVNV